MSDDVPSLNEITERTIAQYAGRAASFWEGTRDHDVSQNMDALLRGLGDEGPYRILDLGCGPGRDLKAFTDRGHQPTGLDGCATFCEMARKHAGCEVMHQDFLTLSLPSETFDGIYSNASIFHVPKNELPRVLGELRAALKKGGVFFSSNPRGENEEGWSGDRYSSFHDLDAWTQFMTKAGFTPIEHYYRPEGLPRAEQPWLASTWRKANI
jgi:SAM-dependent methyltransferase